MLTASVRHFHPCGMLWERIIFL